jgi:hypothetical protein
LWFFKPVTVLFIGCFQITCTKWIHALQNKFRRIITRRPYTHRFTCILKQLNYFCFITMMFHSDKATTVSFTGGRVTDVKGSQWLYESQRIENVCYMCQLYTFITKFQTYWLYLQSDFL